MCEGLGLGGRGQGSVGSGEGSHCCVVVGGLQSSRYGTSSYFGGGGVESARTEVGGLPLTLIVFEEAPFIANQVPLGNMLLHNRRKA